MRIIAGTARGLRLTAPKGRDVRPTLDRVREAYFNILGPQVQGARFLDLFAGTGANGIEALSRGAAQATFVEQDPQAMACIHKNLVVTRLTEQATCVKLIIPNGLTQLSGSFDLVFADPPYVYTEYIPLLNALQDNGLLAGNAQVCIEHDHRTTLPETAGILHLIRQKRYGDTALSFYA